MKVFAALVLLFFPGMLWAQANSQFCLVRDEKTSCVYPTMDLCNAYANQQGGYCRENYRLYGNKGNRLWCLATKYGLRCTFFNKKGCISAASAYADGNAACVENYMLSAKRRETQENLTADQKTECGNEDYGCKVGELRNAGGGGGSAAPPPPPPPPVDAGAGPFGP